MTRSSSFNMLLVPVDFSDDSKAAFARAIEIATGEKPAIVLLHVIDPALPEFAEAHGLGSREKIVGQMRSKAEFKMQEYVDACPDGIEIDPIISEGRPFLEIIQKARDFAVDVIVMSKIGRRGKMEKLLLGSTAEKVLRAATRQYLSCRRAIKRSMN